MRRKKVVILREGHFGDVKEGDYDHWIEVVKKHIEEVSIYDQDTKKDIPAAEVEVINTLDQLRTRLGGADVDVVIFVSRGLLTEVRELKKKYRSVKMFVCTGLIPDDEIIFVDKLFLSNVKTMQHLFLT